MRITFKAFLPLLCVKVVLVSCTSQHYGGNREISSYQDLAFSKDFRLVSDVTKYKSGLAADQKDPWTTVYEPVPGVEVNVFTPSSDDVLCVMNGSDGEAVSSGVRFTPVAAEDKVKCRIRPESTTLHTKVRINYELAKVETEYADADGKLYQQYQGAKTALEAPGMSVETLKLMEALPSYPMARYKQKREVGSKAVTLTQLADGQVLIYSEVSGSVKVKPGKYQSWIKGKKEVTYGPEGIAKFAASEQLKLPVPSANPLSLVCGKYSTDLEYKGLAYSGRDRVYKSYSDAGQNHICSVNIQKLPDDSSGSFSIHYYLIPKKEVMTHVTAMIKQLENKKLSAEKLLNKGNYTKVVEAVDMKAEKAQALFDIVGQELVDLADLKAKALKEEQDQKILAEKLKLEQDAEAAKLELIHKAESDKEQLLAQHNEEKKQLEQEVYRLQVSQIFPAELPFSADLKQLVVGFAPVDVNGKLGYVITKSAYAYSSEAGEFSQSVNVVNGASASQVFNTKQKYAPTVQGFEVTFCPANFHQKASAQGNITKALAAVHKDGASFKKAVAAFSARAGEKCQKAVVQHLHDTSSRLESYNFCYVVSNVEKNAEGVKMELAPSKIFAAYATNSTGLRFSKVITQGNHPFFKGQKQVVVIGADDASSHPVGNERCAESSNFFPKSEELLNSLK